MKTDSKIGIDRLSQGGMGMETWPAAAAVPELRRRCMGWPAASPATGGGRRSGGRSSNFPVDLSDLRRGLWTEPI